MFDIKKLTAGIIAGAAITAAPVIAFAAPASAATNASNPAAASHAQVLGSAQIQLGSGQRVLSGTQDVLGSARLGASHAVPCGGNINCDYCGCPGGG